MRFLAIAGLLLLPAFAAADGGATQAGAQDTRAAPGEAATGLRYEESALQQPALWILGARSLRDAGRLPPELPPDKGRLQLDATGLRYYERAEDRFPELLAIPYEQVTGVTVDTAASPHVALFVTTMTASRATHLFLILDSGSAAAASVAAEARARIAVRMPPAEHVATERAARTQPTAAGKVAVAVATRQIAVGFTTPSPRDAGSAFAESVKVGGAIGLVPLMACSYGGCAVPGFWAPALALAGAGLVGGAVVGIVREMFNASSAAQPPAGMAPGEIESATPVLNATAANALARPVLLQCIRSKLWPGPAGEESPAAINSDPAAAPTATVLDATPPPHADLARDGYRHLVEAYLSRVTLVPAGEPGEKAEEVRWVLLVEGGISIVDLAGNTSRDRSIAQYRTEEKTLRDLSAAGGAAFGEELKRSCDEFGAGVVAEIAKLRQSP